MAVGNFRPTRVKVCPVCRAVGEYPGFCRPCPACEDPQLRLPRVAA